MTADADLTKRQIDWLPYWLTRGHWTAREAAALLVGFLPPEPGDARPLGPWLPGRAPNAWPHREVWELIVQRDLDHAREWLATISDLGTMESWEVIRAAIDARIVPPWLAAFLDSEHAAQLLTGYERGQLRAAIGTEPEAAEKPKTTIDLASAGGRAKRNNDKQRAMFFPTVQRLWEGGMIPAAIIKRLQEEHDPAPPQSTIYGWIAELRRPKAE